MRAIESKTTAQNLQAKKANAPFFAKEGGDAFFSRGAVGSKQDSSPFFSPSAIQPKLTVGQPGDKYEQEADAMADKVVQTLRSPGAAPAIQAKCAACAQEEQMVNKKSLRRQPEEEENPELQPKAIFESNEEQPLQRKCAACQEKNIHPKHIQMQGGSSAASSDLESRLSATRGGGSPLPKDTRGSMESAFGADFSGVRVHTGSESMQMNQELGAQAFTHGSDIYFNRGKYDTGSSGGQHLLAHELTHVVQQGGERLQRKVTPDIQALGDVNERPDNLVCPLPNSSPAGPTLFNFRVDSDRLRQSQKTQLAGFAAGWHAGGAALDLRIDGYASEEGSDPHNWNLSCDRARAVKRELETPSDGSAGIPSDRMQLFAHGETTEFSSSRPPNRRVIITAVNPGVLPPQPAGLQNLKSPRFRGNADLEEVILGERLIRQGDNGDAVARIQQSLIDAGFPIAGATRGIFERSTKRALERYQEANALDVDGVLGPKTMAALDLYYSVDRGTNPLPPETGSNEALIIDILSKGDAMTADEARQARDLLFELEQDEFKRALKAMFDSPAFGAFIRRLGILEILNSLSQMALEVVVPTVLVPPAAGAEIDQDFNRANQIFNPHGIEIEKGNSIVLNERQSRRISGNNGVMNSSPGPSPVASNAELELVKHNRVRNRVTGYWVKASSLAGLRGRTADDQRYTNFLPDRVSVITFTDSNVQDTFAHEIGHALGEPHTPGPNPDPNNLMTGGGARQTNPAAGAIDQLTDAQVQRILQSIHIELGRRTVGQ